MEAPAPKKKKWTKKDEMLYEELCLDNYDEEDCTNFVYRFDDADFDYGYDEEDSVSMWANLTRFLFTSSRKQLF